MRASKATFAPNGSQLRRLVVKNLVSKYLVPTLRVLIPVLILGWLLWKEQDSIHKLTRPRDLRLLAASLACLLTLTCISFYRWYLLVRALDIPFTVKDAMRLGFLGYMLNFVGPGAVGGDLFKAYFVAQGQKERKAEAVATILLDRIVGVFCLFCVASVATFYLSEREEPQLTQMLNAIVLFTIIGVVGVTLLLLPSGFTDWCFVPLTKLPLVGNIVARIRAALELYRGRRTWLLGVFVLGVSVHFLLVVSMNLADRAMHQNVPKFTEHMAISPLAHVAGAAPVPGGLGTFEFAMDKLFEWLPSEGTDKGHGLRVAILYRLLTVVIAGIGALYYAFNRSAVQEAVSEIAAASNEGGEEIPLDGSGHKEN